jgi:hypothetical protein
MVRAINEETMKMMMNDHFANRELSIEELEAIAGGGWFHSFIHGVEHVGSEVWHAIKSPDGSAVMNILGLGLGVAGLIVGAGGGSNTGNKMAQS